MGRDEMIETILKKVIKAIEELELKENSNNVATNTTSNSESVCVNNENIEELVAKKKLVAVNFDKKENIRLGKKYSYEYDLEFLYKVYRNIDADVVLIGEVTPDDLVSMAQGKNPEFGFVMDLLIQGIPIVIPESAFVYRRCKDTCPAGLFNLYKRCEDELKRLGVIFIKDYLDDVQKIGLVKKRKGSNEMSTITTNSVVQVSKSKKLIKESDILNNEVLNAKEIRVAKNSIITPLAKDAIKDNDINVIFE